MSDDRAVEAARQNAEWLRGYAQSSFTTIDEADRLHSAARAIDRLQSQAERMREALDELFFLMDAADDALDKDTYDQYVRDDFDAPDDAEYFVRAGTVCKCSKVFEAIEKMRNPDTLHQPLVLSKEE